MKNIVSPKLSAPLLAVLFVLTMLNFASPVSVRAQDIVSSGDTENIVFTLRNGSSRTGKSSPAKASKKAAVKSTRKDSGRAANDSFSPKTSGRNNSAAVAASTAEPLTGENKEPTLTGGILNGLAMYFESLGVSKEDLNKYRGQEVKVQVTVNAEGEVTKAQAVSGPAPLRETAAKLARKASFDRSRFMANPITLTGDLIYVVGEGDDFRKYDNSPNKTPLVVSGGILNGKEISSLVNGASVASNGEVKVQVTVDEEGNVTGARAVSGNSALYKAATDSAASWTFPRTSVLGNRVKVNGYILMNFKNSID